ncbi:hypothetical protein ANN_26577 [Periplaneta americana]|uniref:Uncharacterized protein n=1 Tax=Periplaneta americana TaxID=6978 RepID=A0ABQ8RYG3_PERAM|nr:hypothetical protein ANN_26577 [Periplaneta americana]
MEGGNEPPGSLKAKMFLEFRQANNLTSARKAVAYYLWIWKTLSALYEVGIRHLRRPRHRWEDNIKIDLREVGYDDTDWIYLAQDRDRSRAYFKVCHGLLYAVMWLADEPREFNLPTLPQRRITYVAEKLPSKYGVHSEELNALNIGNFSDIKAETCFKSLTHNSGVMTNFEVNTQ